MKILKSYEWPGNVRELKNLMYYVDTIIDEEKIDMCHLPRHFKLNTQNTIENSKFEAIILELKYSNYLKESVHILKSIDTWNKENMYLGRSKLQEVLKSENIVLSVDQIRQRLENLKNKGLVVAGSKKQGSFITEEGREFILYGEVKGIF